MSRKKTTSWHLFFQILDVGLSVLSGVVLIPLYLQFISTGTYGAWLATGNILIWITAMDPGLTAVIEQRVASAYGGENAEEVKSTIGAGLLFGAMISVGVLAAGISLSTMVVLLLDLDPSIDGALIRDAFSLAVVGTALLVFSYALCGIDRGLQGTFGAGVTGVVAKGGGIVARIVLLYGGFGLLAIPWGNICAAVTSVLGYGGYLMYRVISERYVRIGFNWTKAKRLARLMGYNFFGKAANVISDNADSFIIARYVGAEAVTAYRLTKKVPDLGNMFLNRVSMAFKPATSHLAGSKGGASSRPVLVRLLLYLTWATGLAVGGVLAFNEAFVGLWVGSEIYAGVLVNVLLCCLLALRSLYDSLSNICYALGNIKGNSVANAVQAGVYIIAIFIGAKSFGVIGVASGAVLAHLLVSAWYYPYAFIQITDMKWAEAKTLLWEVSIVMVLTTTLVYSARFLATDKWGSFLLVIGVFTFCYGVGLLAFSGAFRREVELISRAIRS